MGAIDCWHCSSWQRRGRVSAYLRLLLHCACVVYKETETCIVPHCATLQGTLQCGAKHKFIIDLCVLFGRRKTEVEYYRLGRRTLRRAEDNAPLPYSFGGPHCTCRQSDDGTRFIFFQATRAAAITSKSHAPLPQSGMRPNRHIAPDDAAGTDSDVLAHARTLKDNRSGFHNSSACHVRQGVDKDSACRLFDGFLHVFHCKVVPVCDS